ncbi:MerR family transcriptional regulator [Bdellovibrio sp. HCB117]|uniref:MerR family transcriptional regulator n=1 Tax=Bdellovibrio sp. HCB117 TaxID=3394359 RepID=UPI0039B6A867
MKNWLTIGQFSKAIGVSAKALRLYEKMGLLESHTRGENGYRYYDDSQLSLAKRLKEFKDLGFSLAEIKSLLRSDQTLDSEKLKITMRTRLDLINQEAELLKEQKKQIETILSSIEKTSEPLKADERRVIMSLYGKVSIVVAGVDGLEKTAEYIQKHFKNAHQDVSILHWKENMDLPAEKPYVLVIPERDLYSDDVLRIHPDVVVIKSLSTYSEEIEKLYLKLFSGVGPHVNTVINADDRAAVALVAHPTIKKSRYVYFSKNRALEKQIKNIGGIVSDGEEFEIYGFNMKNRVHLKFGRILSFDEEVALISSLGAVMTVGLEKEQLQIQ